MKRRIKRLLCSDFIWIAVILEYNTNNLQKIFVQKHMFRKLMSQKLARFVIIFCLVSISVFSLNAQTDEPPLEDDKPINVETLLFTIPLTVNDKTGRSITGLQKKNFTIYQDGEEQDIELFMNEEAPMNVAILLDTSYSTKDVLDNIQKAAKDFVKILRKDDKALIAGFDNRTKFLTALTSDRKVLSRAIEQTQVNRIDGSDMYDAIDSVLKRYFNSLKGRKAIIVLTDGIVMGNKINAQQTLDSMQKADTVFYPIIFKTNFYKAKKSSTLVKTLQILSEETNGRFYEKESAKLKEAFQSIAEDLKKQYLIGFYPENTENGKSKGLLKIEVDQKNLFVRAKKRLTLD